MAGLNAFQNRIAFLESIGIQLDPDDVARWEEELKTGSGRGLDELWRNILKHRVAGQTDVLEAWVTEQFGNEEIDQKRMDRLVNDLVSGSRTFQEMREDIFRATGRDPNAEPGFGGDAPEEEDQATEGVGQGDLTILTSKNMRWYFDPSAGKWYVSYALPNSTRQLVFEAEPADMDALFGDGNRPEDFERVQLRDLVSRQGVTLGGHISEMEGTGSFEDEFEQVIARALDEGSLPEWLTEMEEFEDIIFISVTENKSNEWLVEQVAGTKAFQNRFPDLNTFRKQNNLTWTEAVTGFLEFESGMRAMQTQFGLDADSITPEAVAGIMAQGYSMEQVQRTYTQFKRMDDYRPALDAFNEVLVANGMDPMGSLDMVEFLEGNAPQELYDIYEASAINEAAIGQDLSDYFSAQDAIERALATPGELSNQQITQSMQQAAQLVLRNRQAIDLQRFGLDAEDIIDMSLGVTPQSGRPEAEVRETLDRLLREAQAFIGQPGGKPFTGFTQEGVPRAQSLGGLRRQQ